MTIKLFCVKRMHIRINMTNDKNNGEGQSEHVKEEALLLMNKMDDSNICCDICTVEVSNEALPSKDIMEQEG